MKTQVSYREQFFEKLKGDKRFLAYYFATYMQDENLNMDQLARILKCDRMGILRLGACKSPRPGKSTFSARIVDLAVHTNADARALEEIVADAWFRDQMRQPAKAEQLERHLQAARDFEDENGEQDEVEQDPENTGQSNENEWPKD